tara:strand:- start:1620 stop:1976 length:357 start_codon:yes stop_codon:yes gene_type:complete
MIWTVEIPILPKGPNVYMRDHWAIHRRYKVNIASLLLANMPNRNLIPGPVRVTYTEFHARRPKDRTNLAGAYKPIEDQIVRLGILKDDTPEIVVDIQYAQEKVPHVRDQKCRIDIERI